MKKNQNKLDKLFRNKLQEKNFEASNSDWIDMEAMLKERDSVGFFIKLFSKRFYILIALLALLTFSTLFYFSSNYSSNKISNSENVFENEINHRTTERKQENKVNSDLQNDTMVDDESVNTNSTNNSISSKIPNQSAEFSNFLIEEKEGSSVGNSGESVNSHSSEKNEKIDSVTSSPNSNAPINAARFSELNSNVLSGIETGIDKNNDNPFNTNNNGKNQKFDKSLIDKSDDVNGEAQNTNSKMELGKPELNVAEKSDNINSASNKWNAISTSINQYENSSSNINVDVDVIATSLNTFAQDTLNMAGDNSINSSREDSNNLNGNVVSGTQRNSSDNSFAQKFDDQKLKSLLNESKDAKADSLILPIITDSITENIRQRGVSIGMTLSSAFVSKKLKENVNTGDEYIMRRENEESNTIEFHGGVNLMFQFNSILLSSGFDYATYSEKIDYKPISKLTFKDSTYVLIPDSNPNGGNNFDTIYIVFINTVDTLNVAIASQNGKSSWKYLELPVMVWYRIDKGNFVIDAGVGVALGMLQKVNSYYLNNQLSELENINSSGNYRDIVYNVLIAARLNYKVDSNWLIGLDLRYKKNITSVFKSDYPVEQRYHSFNAGVSILYRLNRKK